MCTIIFIQLSIHILIVLFVSSNLVVYLSFVQDEYTVGEMDGGVYVCVELSEVGELTQDPIWVNITSQEDSAIGTRELRPDYLLAATEKRTASEQRTSYPLSYSDNKLPISIFFAAGDDFEMVEAMLYFDGGSGNGEGVCVNVTILDNTAFEKDEYFTLQVVSEMNVVIHDSTSTVHIVDDEGMLPLTP